MSASMRSASCVSPPNGPDGRPRVMGEIARMKNLGPKTETMLREIGIETEAQVREMGAPMLYKVLKHHYGAAVTRIWLYALEGALADRHWNSFSPEEKAALEAAIAADLEIG